ncbi:MAG: hypothetical protein ACFFDP_12670 [Promethearchaeota archaeon]
MEIRDLLTRDITLIVDPYSLKMSPDELLADYGGYIENLIVVAKSSSGRVFYPSQVAPTDEKFPSFFSELVEAAVDIGIKVGAYVNVFADAFFAADPDFQTFTTTGKPLETIVCPNNPNFLQNMAKVIEEVIHYKIQPLFLANLGYASTSFCYCSNCRAEFTEYAELIHDFHIADPTADPNLYEKWIGWRKELMSKAIKTLISGIQKNETDIHVFPTIPVDPELEYTAGTETSLGLDIQTITKASQHLALEVFPWTYILPDPGSTEFNSYIENLSFIETLRDSGVELVMTHWVLEDEVEYNRARAIADAVEIEKIYSMLGYPMGYQAIREIRLGLIH